jgi:hypothetical protein
MGESESKFAGYKSKLVRFSNVDNAALLYGISTMFIVFVEAETLIL